MSVNGRLVGPVCGVGMGGIGQRGMLGCWQVTREDRNRLRLQRKRGQQANKRKDSERLLQAARESAGTDVKVIEKTGAKGAKGGKRPSKKARTAERH